MDAKTIEKNNDGGVRAVDRALDILMAFTANDYELTASELLKRVDLSRPTLYRLLYTLEQSGFVVSSGDPQKFRLGPSVAHLSHVWSSSLDISALAQPMMHRIWSLTSETVALFIPQGDHRLCVAEIPSLQPLSFKRGVGYTERLGLGATGRAIVAFGNYEPAQLKAFASVSKLSATSYEKELKLTRERGYATSRDELITGAVAVAVPFFDGHGLVAGSMGVFGPGVRMTNQRLEELGELLKNESKILSENLGLRATSSSR